MSLNSLAVKPFLFDHIAASDTMTTFDGSSLAMLREEDYANLMQAFQMNRSLHRIQLGFALSPHRCQKLGVSLSHHPSLQSLVFSHSCQLDSESLLQFSESLGPGTSLKSISIINGRLLATSLPCFRSLTVLLSFQVSLQTLTLCRNNLSILQIEPRHIETILASQSQFFSLASRNLTDLNLYACHLSGQSAICLVQAITLASRENTCMLKDLNISANDLNGDDLATELSSMIRVNSTIQTLNIAGHQFYSSQVHVIMSAFPFNNTVTTLIISSSSRLPIYPLHTLTEYLTVNASIDRLDPCWRRTPHLEAIRIRNAANSQNRGSILFTLLFNAFKHLLYLPEAPSDYAPPLETLQIPFLKDPSEVFEIICLTGH